MGDQHGAVVVNGVPAVVTGTAFTAQVPLLEGTNTLTAVVDERRAGRRTTASVQVTLDTTPPQVHIDTPERRS